MNSEPLILLLESSSDLCSAALCKGKELIINRTVNEKNSHSRILAPMVRDLLNETENTFDQLDAVAISAGPGSYTGLRIGTSLAKGICYAQSIPLIAISSLDAIRQAALKQGIEESICALIDARRMDVYTKFFPINESETAEIFCTLSSDFHEENLANEKIVFVGSGSEKLKDILKHPNASFNTIYAEAKDLAILAYDKWTNKDLEDVAYFEPNYIKSVHITAAKKTNFN